MTALELVGWQGRVRRGTYALVGCVGLAIKHNLDRFIALSFGERWSLWSYWAPIGRLSGMQALNANDKKFLLTLFVTAIPFILIFFVVLAAYPSAGEPANSTNDGARHASPFWPRSKWGSAALAVALSTIIGVLGAWAAISGLGSYGLSLFLALPFVMGYVSVWAHTRAHPRSYVDVLAVVSLSVFLAGAGILAIAIEGAICIAMAAPIAWLLALLGGSLAYAIHTAPGLGREQTS